MDSSNALKEERATIDARIQAARQANDFDAEENLERRKVRLPRLINIARETEDMAELAKLKAEAEALQSLEAAADARLKEANEQVKYWQTEAAEAQTEWDKLFAESRSVDIRRYRLERIREIRAALLQAKTTGEALRVDDSFYAGISVADLRQLNDEVS